MTTDTTTTTAALTTADLLALRTCQSVSFHAWKDGEFVIRCTIEVANYDGTPKILTAQQQEAFNELVDGRERRRTIHVNGAIRGYYGEMSEWTGDENATAFAMIHSAQFDTTWRTTAQMLKAGDVLALSFRGSNNNGYLKAAGLHLDSAHLMVERPTKDAQRPKRYMFHLDTTVTPDNSARMVRRYGS